MLRSQLTSALKEAMVSKDTVSVATIRLILAALKDRDINARSLGKGDEQISDADILGLLQSMIKQRHESIRQYKEGNREDLVGREESEIAVIQTFLPKALSEDETRKAIDDIANDLGAASIKDMGKVMNELKSRYAGQLDMGKTSQWVKDRLTAA